MIKQDDTCKKLRVEPKHDRDPVLVKVSKIFGVEAFNE